MITTIDQAELNVKPLDWGLNHHEYFNPGELEIIAALVNGIDARTMVEIGCRDGRTARVLLDNVPSLDHYIGIDVPLSYQPGIPGQKNEMVSEPGRLVKADPRFELILLPNGSRDLTALEPCDVVFIDGDHSRAVVAHDSSLAHAAIKDPGLIIWHDYNSAYLPDVTDVLGQLNWPIKHVAGTWLAYLSTDTG